MQKASAEVVLLSGGMDSATLLYDYGERLASKDLLVALSFDYGQRHVRELNAARTIVRVFSERYELQVQRRVVYLQELAQLFSAAGSCLTSEDIEVPHGHYAAANMKKTVVPNRNMIMLSIALGHAFSLTHQYLTVGVAIASHAGDHTIYPDCRPKFNALMREAAAIAYFSPVHLVAPFEKSTKAAIVRRGYELGVPYEFTWSCYEGGDVHCGKCGTCVERREAFELAGIPDPTVYARELNGDSTGTP